MKTKFEVDLSRLYCIWFSLNENEGLDPRNRLRLIRLRQKHPQHVVHLVYSATCLRPEALKSHLAFCKSLGVIPIALEDIVSPYENDMLLKALALREIEFARKQAGGNMAAASDCARMMVFLAKLGNYFDLDVSVDISHLYKLSVEAPVLLSAETMQYQNKTLLVLNSDFLIFSRDPENPEKLSAAALQAIRNVQKKILANYQSFFSYENIFQEFFQWDVNQQLIYHIFKLFRLEHPTESREDIFYFRQFLFELECKENVEVFMKTRQNLMKYSVIAMSGPGVMNELFVSMEHPFIPYYLENPPYRWSDFLLRYKRANIDWYPELQKGIHNTNSLAKGIGEESCDSSWTPEGLREKKAFEIELQHSALLLQSLFRRWADSREGWQKDRIIHGLLPILKKIPHSETTAVLLQKSQYAAALRHAAKHLELEIVEFLLNQRCKKALILNINAISEEGETSLDCIRRPVIDYSDEKQIQRQFDLEQLLLQSGARMAVELGFRYGNLPRG